MTWRAFYFYCRYRYIIFNSHGLYIKPVSIKPIISFQVDVNSRIHDVTQTPPLHLAGISGNEMLVRSLILAGARVNDTDANRNTALHVAAKAGHATVVSALLQVRQKLVHYSRYIYSIS